MLLAPLRAAGTGTKTMRKQQEDSIWKGNCSQDWVGKGRQHEADQGAGKVQKTAQPSPGQALAGEEGTGPMAMHITFPRPTRAPARQGNAKVGADPACVFSKALLAGHCSQGQFCPFKTQNCSAMDSGEVIPGGTATTGIGSSTSSGSPEQHEESQPQVVSLCIDISPRE